MAKIYFERLNTVINEFCKEPSPSRINIPSWWKDSEYYLPSQGVLSPVKNHRNFGTIRACPAISDFINYGYTLYIPTDIYVDATGDSIEWVVTEIDGFEQDFDFSEYINFHKKDQLGEYRIDGYHGDVLKINTFWGIKTEPGYSVLITHPQHRDDLPFRTFSSIVDTDVFPARFPYPLVIKKGFSGVIKGGTPLIQILPFRREDFVAEKIDFSAEDVERQKNSLNLFFTNAYKKIYWNRKKFQ